MFLLGQLEAPCGFDRRSRDLSLIVLHGSFEIIRDVASESPPRPALARPKLWYRRDNVPRLLDGRKIFSSRRCRTASLPGIAAEASYGDHSNQDAKLNKLLTEMNRVADSNPDS
jgi:hypothetical protein